MSINNDPVPGKCKARVRNDGRWPSFHQCQRNHDGVTGYCKQHNPVNIEAKKVERKKAWDAEWAAKTKAWDEQKRIVAAGKASPMLVAALKRAEYHLEAQEYLDALAVIRTAIAEWNKGDAS